VIKRPKMVPKVSMIMLHNSEALERPLHSLIWRLCLPSVSQTQDLTYAGEWNQRPRY
jgi:hypothetical protein